MKKLFVVYLILITSNLEAQHPEESPFLNDFNYLIEQLEATHPDPYTGFGGRPYFYREKESVKEQLKGLNDTLQFYHTLNAFLSHIGDGHTTLHTPQVRSDVPNRYLPLLLRVAQDGIYIHHTDEIYQHIAGGRLKAINDKPVEKWLEQVAQIKPAENRFGNYKNLTDILSNTVNVNPLLGNISSLKIKVEKENNILEEIVSYQEQINWTPQKSFIQNEKENPILFSRMLDGVGYVRWNSILARELIDANIKNGWDASSYIQWAYGYLNKKPTGDALKDAESIPSLYQTFAELLSAMKKEDSGDLIIDLRFNSGGMTPMVHPVVYMLYGDTYVTTDFDIRYDTYLSPLLLKKWNMPDIDTFNQQRGSNYKMGDFILGGFLPKTKEEREEQVQGWQGVGEEWIKKGIENRPENLKVYVLVSPQTFSAAYHFTFFLWKMGATTVGVTPLQAGNTFMETTSFTLPETNLSGSISNSIQLFFPNDPILGKEFTPDIPLYWRDYESYGFDYDAELLKVLDVIKQ